MDDLRTDKPALSPTPHSASLSCARRQCTAHGNKTPSRKGKPSRSKNIADELDQFYTLPRVAKEHYRSLCNRLDLSNHRFIEPSAGTGSFSNLLPPGSRAYDLDPKAPGIVKADFLKTRLERSEKNVVIGNPPFGNSCDMAIKFFNHAAKFASVIAFIVPRTFQKQSITNRLNLSFHLLTEMTVEDNAFVFEGQPRNVPTVFQIWIKKEERREKQTAPTEHSDFDFTSADDANFAIQRIGSNAGLVHRNLKMSKKSHYFIKPNVEGVETIMKALDFAAAACRTAGNPSLAKTEVVALYAEYKANNPNVAGFPLYARMS